VGSHSKVIIATRPETQKLVAAAMNAAGLHFSRAGSFLIIDDSDAPLQKENAKALSDTLEDHVVAHWIIHTATNLISLNAYENGEKVREILHTGDDGLVTDSGFPLPFENAEALKARLVQRHLSASPGGYKVLEAFMGWGDIPPEAALEIRDENPTLRTFLPENMVREVRKAAGAQGQSPTNFLAAVWENSKHNLLDVLKSSTAPDPQGQISDVALAPSQPPLGIDTHIPAKERGTLTGEGVLCEMAFSPDAASELQAMLMAFDRPIAALLKDAYRMERAA
jgi:hypothetical protein